MLLEAPLFIPFAIFLYFYYNKNKKLPMPVGLYLNPFFGVVGLPEPQAPPPPPTPTPPVCPTCPTCPDKEAIKKAVLHKVSDIPVQVSEQGQFSKVGYGVPFTETQTTTIGGLVKGAETAITGLQNFDEKYGVQLQWRDGIDQVSVQRIKNN